MHHLSHRRIGRTLLGAALATGLLGASSAHAATYTVTSTADAVHGACTASTCSLRDAVIAANATTADDTIVLGAGSYKLTLAGRGEDASATGDLDVVDATTGGALTLRGASARTTTVDASGIGSGGDRVLHVLSNGKLTLEHLTVSGGTASDGDGGGGVLTEPGSTFDAADVTITGNQGTTVNSGFGGGGGLATNGTSTLVRTTFTDNTSAGNGGAFYQSNGDLTITDSTLADNHVDTTLAPGKLYGAYGGAGQIGGDSLTLRNVTVTGNTLADPPTTGDPNSGGYGPAFDGSTPAQSITNVLVADNVTSAAILAGNPGSDAQCDQPLDATTDTAPNLDTDGSCFQGTAAIEAAPKLGALADNGGETDTVALLPGSPGIDQGDTALASPADQRGVARQGRADIGAFEFRAEADLGVTASAPATASTGQPVTQSFVVTDLGGTTTTATGVKLATAVPAGATLSSITSTKGTCVVATATCQIGSLADGASATVKLTLTRTDAGTIATKATVSGAQFDPVAANDTATATTSVTAPAPPQTTPTTPTTPTTTTTTTATTATTPVVPPGVPPATAPTAPAAPVKQRPRKLSLTASPKRDRSVPFRFRLSGKLTLPSGVGASAAVCTGKVTLRVKAGKRTLLTRTLTLSTRCTYGATVKVAVPTKLRTRGRKLSIKASFAGNAALSSRSSATRTVRVR